MFMLVLILLVGCSREIEDIIDLPVIEREYRKIITKEFEFEKYISDTIPEFGLNSSNQYTYMQSTKGGFSYSVNTYENYDYLGITYDIMDRQYKNKGFCRLDLFGFDSIAVYVDNKFYEDISYTRLGGSAYYYFRLDNIVDGNIYIPGDTIIYTDNYNIHQKLSQVYTNPSRLRSKSDYISIHFDNKDNRHIRIEFFTFFFEYIN